MDDLTKARRLPPEEIEAMRERVKEAEHIMDKVIAKAKQRRADIVDHSTKKQAKRAKQ